MALSGKLFTAFHDYFFAFVVSIIFFFRWYG